MIPILPFMEQQNLFDIYKNFGGLDTSGPRYGGSPNNQVCSARLKSFTCPSDNQGSWGSLTKHNYVLNAGNTSFFQCELPLGCAPGTPGCMQFLGAPFNWYTGSTNWDSTVPWSGPGAPPPELGKMGRPVKVLDITDGNLSVHARRLEEAEYIVCRKSFDGRVPRTDYRLTTAGRRALERYLDHMAALIKAMRSR